jgi:hypothetical protein
MSLLRSVLAVALCIGCVTVASAQDTTRTANLRPTPDGRLSRLELRDGSALNGRVLEVTATTVRFSSSIGETTILRTNIASVHLIDAESIHDGEVWLEDPSRTRLFFAPTGRMLRAGENYFSDAYVFFPSGQSGITDRITVGGGMSLVPGLSLDEQLFFVTPKVGLYASDNVHVAVGALVAGAKKLFDVGPAGVGYGVATFGGENSSLTTAAGFVFANGETASSTLLMIGGSTRVARSLALVTENYIVSGHANSVFSAGVRVMSEHIAVDIAAAGGPSIDTFLPYLAFIYRW